MSGSDPVSFDEKGARRIVEATRYVESLSRAELGAGSSRRTRLEPLILKCKCTEEIPADGWGRCEIYKGEKGSEEASGIEIDVFCSFREVPADDAKWLFVAWVNNGYEVIAYLPC